MANTAAELHPVVDGVPGAKPSSCIRTAAIRYGTRSMLTMKPERSFVSIAVLPRARRAPSRVHRRGPRRDFAFLTAVLDLDDGCLDWSRKRCYGKGSLEDGLFDTPWSTAIAGFLDAQAALDQ